MGGPRDVPFRSFSLPRPAALGRIACMASDPYQARDPEPAAVEPLLKAGWRGGTRPPSGRRTLRAVPALGSDTGGDPAEQASDGSDLDRLDGRVALVTG